jgi:TonB family protein
MRLWNKVVQLLLAPFIWVFFSSTSFGQINPGRTYFDSNKRDCDSINAVGYREIVYSFEGPKTIQTVQTYRMNGTLKSETIRDHATFPQKYSKRKLYDSLARLTEIQQLYLNNIEGPFEKFYPNGALKAKGNYHLNNYDDTLKGYYPNGAMKRMDVFCDGKLIEGKCFGIDGKDTTHFPFFQQASFPRDSDLKRYVQMNMIYPQVAKEQGIQGKCYLKFKVNPNGSISDVEVVRGIAGCPECDQEALRLIKEMPNWTPAINDEQLSTEALHYSIPIYFYFE